MISTRGRYAIRVMVDLAEHSNGKYIPMKEVALRQEISLKYIEKIMSILTKNKLVEGLHGKGGGYCLVREPEKYTLGEILRLTEGGLAPVACLEEDAKPCPRASQCRTLSVWKDFYQMTNRFFDGITIADLMRNDGGYDFVI